MAVKMFERLFIVIDYTVEKLLLIDKIIVRSLIYRLWFFEGSEKLSEVYKI